MRHSIIVALVGSFIFTGSDAQAASKASFRLSAEHGRVAGAERARLERYGQKLKGKAKEAFVALTRGVFEYARQLSALIADSGGFGIGLRAAIAKTARLSLVSAIHRGKPLGRGFVDGVRAHWRALLDGVRGALGEGAGGAVARGLENRFHSLAMNARAIFYGALPRAKGTVKALLTGFRESLGPRMKALGEKLRSDAAAARKRFVNAGDEPNS